MINTNSTEFKQLLPVLRFWGDHGVTINEVSDNMYRVNITTAIDGFDTSRTYPTYDLAVLAVIQAAANSGKLATGAAGKLSAAS
jgi:hypothetical protein